MTNKHMRRYSKSLATEKMQLKSTEGRKEVASAVMKRDMETWAANDGAPLEELNCHFLTP